MGSCGCGAVSCGFGVFCRCVDWGARLLVCGVLLEFAVWWLVCLVVCWCDCCGVLAVICCGGLFVFCLYRLWIAACVCVIV